MPPRKKPVEPTPPPAPGHNTPELTDDALIAENFKLEDHVKAESEKFANFLKPFKDRITEKFETLIVHELAIAMFIQIRAMRKGRAQKRLVFE